MMDSTCIFIQQQIDAERKVYSEVPKESKPIVIPHSIESETDLLQNEIDALAKAYPEVKKALETNEPYILEVSLQELSAIVPRTRVRVDAYSRLQRLLLTKNIDLRIFSRRIKK